MPEWSVARDPVGLRSGEGVLGDQRFKGLGRGPLLPLASRHLGLTRQLRPDLELRPPRASDAVSEMSVPTLSPSWLLLAREQDATADEEADDEADDEDVTTDQMNLRTEETMLSPSGHDLPNHLTRCANGRFHARLADDRCRA